MTTNLSHNNNFHLLRHVAAFMVLYGHCTVPGDVEFFHRITNHRLEMTSLGVNIFFIISGYLVTQSLLFTATSWQFARKRWLRIWPGMFVVTLALCFVLGPIVTTMPAVEYFKSFEIWYFFFRNIFFLPVYTLPGVFIGHSVNATFWTIFFEVLCYAFLLTIGRERLLKGKSLIITIWFLLLVWIYFVPALLNIPEWLQPYTAALEGPVFYFYSGGAWLLVTRNQPAFGAKIYVPAIILFLVSVAFNLPFPKWLQTVSIVLCVIEWGCSKAIFRWPKWDISYGVYLIGWPVEMLLIHSFDNFKTSSLKLTLATLAITIPLAFVSWYGIEKRALKMK